jgi:DNA topoisomerase IB
VPRTRRVDCTGPGLHRVRRGRGFSYHDEAGERVDDPELIERIAALAIPPAWTDVWICSDPRGHIQATGVDDAGRKQYRYHDDWRAHRDRHKFERMLDFARRLPALRERIDADLGGRGLTFGRVAAGAVALLDQGLFRVGGERYEDENESYGLTTLKVEHVRFRGGAAEFDYPAKSGQRSSHRISDPRLVTLVRALARRGEAGDDLFTYREGRTWHDLDARQVNERIKAAAGEEFSAKDFRTWNATVLAAGALAGNEPGGAAGRRKRAKAEAVALVAEQLNNTEAVARGSYIDPRVFDRFDSGETIAASLRGIESHTEEGEFAAREAIERAVIRLLSDD